MYQLTLKHIPVNNLTTKICRFSIAINMGAGPRSRAWCSQQAATRQPMSIFINQGASRWMAYYLWFSGLVVQHFIPYTILKSNRGWRPLRTVRTTLIF